MALSRLNPLPSPGAPQPAPGEYADPGSPGQMVSGVGQFGDQVRGTVMETPILILAVGYLYNKTFIKGSPERSWGVTDVVLVIVVAHLIKRLGVANRWGSM